jgi:hypothetical protein
MIESSDDEVDDARDLPMALPGTVSSVVRSITGFFSESMP